MFSSISWQEYWTSLTLITFAYYLVIYLLYFKKGKQLSSQEHEFITERSPKEESQPTLFEVDSPDSKQRVKEGEEHMIQGCMDELNAFFENHKRKKAIKNELIFGLYTILQKYPSIINSDYRESLTNVIAAQCESICSIHLSAEELKGVWFG